MPDLPDPKGHQTGSFRTRLREGRPITAMFSILPEPQIIELIALAGFDAIIIDMEHGPNSVGNLPPLVLAAQAHGRFPIVRVPECAEPVIAAALDIGASAVLVPQVQSAAQAELAVAAARYAPEGRRGLNPWTRAARFGATANWPAVSNRDTGLMVMIEGPQGLAELDAILAVPGIDAIFLGPVDMAHALGLTGQPEHPSVVAAIEQAVARAGACGVGVGVFARHAASARHWLGIGVRFVAVSEDTVAILEAFSTLRAQLDAD